jgi:muconolactone delta-isomerase
VRALAVQGVERRVSRAYTEWAIYQLLTDDQKAALAKLRDQEPARKSRR